MIVHVIGSMGAGGIERLCLELIRRAPPGVPQALITIDASPNEALAELFHAVPNLLFFHEPYSARHRANFVVRLARLLRRLKPRGVVAYPFGLHVFVALACKAVRRCRFIVHVGNPPPLDGHAKRLYVASVRLSRWLRTPMWCCSATVFRQCVELGLGLPPDSRAQPNGVDTDALAKAAARGQRQRSQGGPVLAMAARLNRIKDHDTLLAAFADVLKQQPNASLWLVGDGERRPTLEAQAHALGIAPSVRFLGVRDDMGELLGQVDLFVFSTTRAEGFGIALAEAMAAGLAVIASDVPACREVLDGGRCGVLVPPADKKALGGAILALLDDPARAQALGKAAEERCRRTYDITSCAENYYEYLLATNPIVTRYATASPGQGS